MHVRRVVEVVLLFGACHDRSDGGGHVRHLVIHYICGPMGTVGGEGRVLVLYWSNL